MIDHNEIRRAHEDYARALDAIHSPAPGHILTYRGQPVTSLQAFDLARSDFEHRVVTASRRHQRDRDDRASGLFRQLWAMIRGAGR